MATLKELSDTDLLYYLRDVTPMYRSVKYSKIVQHIKLQNSTKEQPLTDSEAVALFNEGVKRKFLRTTFAESVPIEQRYYLRFFPDDDSTPVVDVDITDKGVSATAHNAATDNRHGRNGKTSFTGQQLTKKRKAK
jgi:hypothetical protein